MVNIKLSFLYNNVTLYVTALLSKVNNAFWLKCSPNTIITSAYQNTWHSLGWLYAVNAASLSSGSEIRQKRKNQAFS